VREVTDFDDLKFQCCWRDVRERVSDLPIERFFSQTADDDGDVVRVFHDGFLISIWSGSSR
jgi:hypothetical protein